MCLPPNIADIHKNFNDLMPLSQDLRKTNLGRYSSSDSCFNFDFRQTQLLESHVSGHMVKKETTDEGEVS